MKGKLIYGLISIIVLGCYVVFAVPAMTGQDDTYTGKLSFDTEQEYTQFKQEIVNSEAIWNRMDVLSSDPPILVQFRVQVSQDYDFPYGEKSNIGPTMAIVFGVLLVFLIVCLGLAGAVQQAESRNR